MPEPDEVVESSSTPEAAVVEGTPGNGDASAGTENTDSPEPKEHMIPKSRLDEVIGKQRAAEEERDALQVKVAGYEKPDPPTPSATEDMAPDHLEERDRIRWFIENDSRKMIEKQLGMKLEDAKTLLSTSRVTAESDANRRWKEGCDSRSLDPKSKDVQEMVLGLTKIGVKVDEAFDRVAKLGVGTVSKSNEPSTPSASVEDTGVTGVMTKKEVYATNAREAVDLASKGIRARQKSSQEIIEESMAKA